MKKEKAPSACNVLQFSLLGKHLWQFSADGGKAVSTANITLPLDKPAPPNLAAKDWRTLLKPRVNIAWLPAEQIFLRVVQLPQADAAEITLMLEFQLEKLSPMPATQIVWSFELVASSEINNVTAIVIIAPRDVVEEKIGAIEAGGYQPDRLELPQVYQIVADAPQSDGVWIYPWKEGAREFCIATWWATGSIRNLQLIHLPAEGDKAGLLREALLKTAWAGEMEGWLTFPVRWKIVAPPDVAAEWQGWFKDWAEGTVEASAQMPAEKLAEFAASRVARGQPAANLLPPEFAARYRQQFVDRLWMRGLLALIAVYLTAVLGYFLAVQGLRVRKLTVDRQLAGIAQSYTNTLKMKERVQVLQDQQALKYAALDSWKIASDALPAEVTLASLIFGGGDRLELRGTAENAKALADYNDELRKSTLAGEPFFKNVSPPNSTARPGSGALSWNFTCIINRPEI